MVKELKNITGVIVKMQRKDDIAKTVLPRQQLHGIVTRDGKPVKSGWVGLWYLRPDRDVVNASIQRGRVVAPQGIAFASATIIDGKYRLEAPPYDEADWHVVVETPDRSLTQIGPIRIKLREERKLDIACVPPGSISGKVKDVPKGWEGYLWIVAFTKTGIRAETRVQTDGGFFIPSLAPGEYGLKVGHDGYLDPEVPRGKDLTPASHKISPDPWKAARTANVKSGQVSTGVELTPPAMD